ncbi:MAG TPA: DUF3037 domain-containing protein [Candidatus Methylomirabilis sp.]|nr:DUF3037 domain-containing protein [Candidatus Methylomirabilis sp.]
MTESAPEHAIAERLCAYRILRYTPNLIRDEWVNIGVLVYDPRSGERRLRLIEEQEEYARVRRLHPAADEALLRGLRDDLENRFESALRTNGQANGGNLQELLQKWDETLANTLQLAPQKGVIAGDLDAELERLYTAHVAVPRAPSRIGAPGSRAQMRSYCSQVLRQARLWERMQKAVRASEFTFPGDPMRLDYSYRRNGTLGFVHTLPVSRAPGDAKSLAYTAEQITSKASLKTEFTAVTDVELTEQNDRNRFVDRTLRDAGIEPVSLEHFAVWVGKLKPLIQ